MVTVMVDTTIRDREELDALDLEDLYRAVPIRNEDAKEVTAGNGLVLEVPLKKPEGRWRPVSWFVPFPSRRRIHLDELGVDVLSRCDGRNSVKDIIFSFAARYRLTFHESRLSIMMFLKSLIERGAVAVILKERRAGIPG